jgi:hypothetical protein
MYVPPRSEGPSDLLVTKLLPTHIAVMTRLPEHPQWSQPYGEDDPPTVPDTAGAAFDSDPPA